MKHVFSSGVAILALAALTRCGNTGNAAMPYTPAAPAAAQPQLLHPHILYHFRFSNNTGEGFHVTRSDVSCMLETPPETFRLEAGQSRDYDVVTTCLLDPSTFRLAFVSPYTQIAATYTKDTGKPWKVTLSDQHLLKLDFRQEASNYVSSIHL
jgi:predicted small lipoprotein YifL